MAVNIVNRCINMSSNDISLISYFQTGKANVPEETKKNVRSVLISNPKGVRLPYFERDYRSLLGHGVPWRKHGYTSLASFMAALPDVVRY